MENPAQPGTATAPIAAGVQSALGASVCCAGPLVLVAMTRRRTRGI